MSTFYGTVEGQRGPATRCGSRSSGIRTAAQSWDGSVIVNLSYSERDGEDTLMVDINTSENSSAYGHHIWHGSFNEFVELLEHDADERRFQERFNW